MGGGGGAEVSALLQLANFTLGPDASLNTEIHKNSVRIKATNSMPANAILISESKMVTYPDITRLRSNN